MSMSTDLQFRQELLEIRCPAITITVNLTTSSDVASDDNPSGAIIQSQESTTISDGNGLEDECRTPKSPRHMIPEILSCPPAPKKPRIRVASCKRKLCDFFEIVAREEVESFFRHFEVKPSTGDTAIKKRCLV